MLYWPVYHIFHNTDTSSPFCLCKREGIESKALKKTNFEKKLEKNFEKKMFKKKFQEKKFEKSFETKNLKKMLGKKFLEKSFDKKNFGKINYKSKIFINKIYSNIVKCHTIFVLLAPFDRTGRQTGSNENVCGI